MTKRFVVPFIMREQHQTLTMHHLPPGAMHCVACGKDKFHMGFYYLEEELAFRYIQEGAQVPDELKDQLVASSLSVCDPDTGFIVSAWPCTGLQEATNGAPN